MNKPMMFVALISMGFCVFGCKRETNVPETIAETYGLRFTSEDGAIFATGVIELSKSLPVAGEIEGRFRLQVEKIDKPSKEIDWFYRLFDGKTEGRLEWKTRDVQQDVDVEMREFAQILDFMPGTHDANITAILSPMESGRAKGHWYYETFSGGNPGGRFEVEKK